MKVIIGLLLVALPFIAVVWLMGRGKRNRGSTHGGGIDGYWDIKSGRR